MKYLLALSLTLTVLSTLTGCVTTSADSKAQRMDYLDRRPGRFDRTP